MAAVTKQDLLNLIEELSTKRDEADAAHAATLSAQQNVVDVTTIAQGRIDSATAQFDVETTTAKQQVNDAQTAQDTAEGAEQTTFDSLLTAIQNFKTES